MVLSSIQAWVSRRARFSLRAGLMMFLLVAIAFGLIGRWIHNVRQRGAEQLRFIKRCEAGSRESRSFGYVHYAPEANVNRFTALVRHWVHPEFNRTFRTITVSSPLLEMEPPIDPSRLFGAESVQVSMFSNDATTFLQLFQIPGLKRLIAGYPPHPDSDSLQDWSLVAHADQLETIATSNAGTRFLAELGKLPMLKELHIAGCEPEALMPLAATQNIEKLSVVLNSQEAPPSLLTEVEIDQHQAALKMAFDELANREKLIHLQIVGRLPVTPSALAKFCAKSPLKTLSLRNTQSAPECLSEIAKLPALQVLEIHDELLTDAHLDQLQSAKQLKAILVGPNISDDAIIQLREKLPSCNILKK